VTPISSKWTFFYKKAFPVLWFGFIALFVVVALASGAAEKDFMALVMPCLIAVFGFFMFRKLIWNLADEVVDAGDALIVRNHGEEERVPLSNIMNVSASTLTNPARITLRLAQAGRFGNEIVFSPKRTFTLNPFARNPVAEDLIVRVDGARRSR
jgi:hypothetical protein